jgi:hypothetical protein
MISEKSRIGFLTKILEVRRDRFERGKFGQFRDLQSACLYSSNGRTHLLGNNFSRNFIPEY